MMLTSVHLFFFFFRTNAGQEFLFQAKDEVSESCPLRICVKVSPLSHESKARKPENRCFFKSKYDKSSQFHF